MTQSTKVLLTGASGFIGRRLAEHLSEQGYGVIACVRQLNEQMPSAVAVGDIDAATNWASVLEDVDVVVHLAATVHITDGAAGEQQYVEVNREGTLHLARQAHIAGVRRLIFLSSIKVNGEATSGKPFDEADDPAPMDPYAVSKLEAEQGLLAIAEQSGLEVVIVRPPLVYGPGVKANFLAMLKAVDKGMPLPLASISNRRSLVSLDNLASFIATCIDHPAAKNEVFVISDSMDVSTPELIRMIAAAMEKQDRLFSFPLVLLKALAMLSGRTSQIERLTGSLQIDPGKARRLLGWEAPCTMHESIRKTVDWYREHNS